MTEPPKQDSPTKASPSESQSPQAISPLIKIFASGLFSGYAPFASGTVGTFVGILVYLIPSFAQTTILLPACAIVFVLGSLAAEKMEKAYGHDPSIVTIDEVSGNMGQPSLVAKIIPHYRSSFFSFPGFRCIQAMAGARVRQKAGGMEYHARRRRCRIIHEHHSSNRRQNFLIHIEHA